MRAHQRRRAGGLRPCARLPAHAPLMGCSARPYSQILDAFGACLYDAMRPHLVKVASLDVLTEVCDVLAYEMLEDSIRQHADDLVAIAGAVTQLLEDTQVRLVFRAQAFVQEIARYVAQPEDLAYPEKLLSPTPSPASGDAAQADAAAQQAGARTPGFATWYPTLQRTLVFLSKLYRSVNVRRRPRCLLRGAPERLRRCGRLTTAVQRKVFEGISQEAVSACLNTLTAASVQIEARKGPVDSCLFLIRHLLTLREQLSPFNADLRISEKQLSFGRLRGTTAALAHGRSARAAPWLMWARYCAQTWRHPCWHRRAVACFPMARAVLCMKFCRRACRKCATACSMRSAYVHGRPAGRPHETAAAAVRPTRVRAGMRWPAVCAAGRMSRLP